MSHPKKYDNVIPFPMAKKKELSEERESMERVANFQLFAMLVRGGDDRGAGAVLSALLELDLEIATKSAEHFIKRLKTHTDLMDKVMSIRFAIVENRREDALLLINECFNLSDANAERAFSALTKRVFQAKQS